MAKKRLRIQLCHGLERIYNAMLESESLIIVCFVFVFECNFCFCRKAAAFVVCDLLQMLI